MLRSAARLLSQVGLLQDAKIASVLVLGAQLGVPGVGLRCGARRAASGRAGPLCLAGLPP